MENLEVSFFADLYLIGDPWEVSSSSEFLCNGKYCGSYCPLYNFKTMRNMRDVTSSVEFSPYGKSSGSYIIFFVLWYMVYSEKCNFYVNFQLLCFPVSSSYSSRFWRKVQRKWAEYKELQTDNQHSQGLSNNPYPRNDTYLFKIQSKVLFPIALPVKILKLFLSSSILATWPVHLNLLDLIILTTLDEWYKLWSSPFVSLLGPNIHLRILFSNILSLHSSLNVRDHASHPYSTTGNIIVLYTLIFKFWERSLEDKSVWTE